MMNTAKVNAYAKLNLTLDVVGEEDGFHLIDSLVTSVDLYDRVVVRKRKDALVNIVMRGMGSEVIPPEQNNALKAGEKFVSAFRTTGADVTVYKNIPIGAGLGGSSADAAGVLAGLAKLYGVAPREIEPLADECGSDTKFMLRGGLARMRGRGTELEYFDFVPEMYFLLICPKSEVSTAECYRRSKVKEGAGRTERALETLFSNLEWSAKLFGNDLYEPACSLNEEVGKALFDMKCFSPIGAGMTGSGSGVFGLFASKELCDWAKSRYRGKARVFTVKALDPKKKKLWRNPFVLGDGEGV